MLIPERSFYFRGPEGKLRLRAHNLVLFVELAAGVDDDTWLFHLRNGDYARWFEAEIGDRDLADEARRVIAFGGQMIHIQGQDMLGTGVDAQLTALTIIIADFNPSLYGHYSLLVNEIRLGIRRKSHLYYRIPNLT
jgi:hypothetical protein